MFGKFVREQRGQTFLELLIAMPIIFLMIYSAFEFGSLFYNKAIINYSSSVAAVKAATRGQFTGDIRRSQAEFIKNWAIGGKEYTYLVNETNEPSAPSENIVYICGTDKDSEIQRGSNISGYVIYPVKFKVPILNKLGSVIAEDKVLIIKTHFDIPSEVFFE
ncbi:MAG: TadE/TadG family type IV pilus assembly protein [Bacillota bacterium]